MVRIKISSGYDPFDNTEVIRYAEEESTVLNCKEKKNQINICVKHYLIIGGVETYADLRYSDHTTYIQARNDEYINLQTNEYLTHEMAYNGSELKPEYEMGVNIMPIYDYFEYLRTQTVIFDEIIEAQILSSDLKGEFNGYNYLNFV